MIPAFLAVLTSFRSLFRSRAALHAEALALRHQLLVLERQRAGTRVLLRTSDRLLWVWLSKIWPGWCQALVLVQPERRPGRERERGEIIALPKVGGLHHRYERRAA